MRNMLFGNSYPILFIDNKINGRLKGHSLKI